MENKKVLLSIKDLYVKFRVRGRILTAIRGISLDIYENECIAIVGESGSGKSVFTKTFAGMLDSNGFVDQGTIIFNDYDLAEVHVAKSKGTEKQIAQIKHKLDLVSGLSLGSDTWRQILELESAEKRRGNISEEEEKRYAKELKRLKYERTNRFNESQVYDPRKEKDKIAACKAQIKELDAQIKKLETEKAAAIKKAASDAKNDTAAINAYKEKLAELKKKHEAEIQGQVDESVYERNEILAKEVCLSVRRFPWRQRRQLQMGLIQALADAMQLGEDLDNDLVRNRVFDDVAFRVSYIDETDEELHGHCILNLANMKYEGDWVQIRGTKIATVFQDPMTSLNPIVTIGKQMSNIIIKHQGCTEAEARVRAIEMMAKVGIPNPESRFDDYPFQYSGGMRQRIVIAIALSCQPKILICDEPTTALDVTIQAQILQLIKDLQKEFGYTTVFITHDLGVVANVADRVAVLYGGQVIEVGTVEEVFYDPKHPYTWALLSSLPQLAEKNTELFSIKGTPPSLYNEIKGDAFAPRNPYCMKIDTLAEPPMFKVSETHYAKTWLLHEDSPKVEKPEAIQNIHEKLVASYNL